MTTGWRWVVSAKSLWMIWFPIGIVTAAHYATGAGHHWAHDIFRRLYYIPIVLAGFAFGVRGALLASVAVSIVYSPHAFSHVFHQDPGTSIEKALEVLLYNVIAYITGMLADRERRERLLQEKIAKQLAESLDELKLMEQQLIRQGKLQALGELTAGLAHEIRNPLASLKGATEIISDEIPLDSPRRKMVDILNKELDRLSTVLERFLSFARPPSFTVSNVRLAEVVEHVTVLMEAQARKCGVELHAEVPDSMVVRGDKQNITLVLMNLVLNAIQAMPDGGAVHLRCTKESRGKRQYCRLDVRDTGPGVPEELREKIFNPFFTTKEKGSGLGLSVAARLVDAHEGLLEVTSSPGKGTTFSVLLPLG